jgi:hypothetical protein
MKLELVATWLGMILTIAGGIYKMGKQAQRMDDQEEALKKLETKVDENKDIPIKLATLETDVKYLIQGISELKQILLKVNIQ